MQTITRHELARALRTGSDIRLVCALGAWGFATGHIPGSLSLPTPAHARAALPVDADIVVYGRDRHDPAPRAAVEYLVRHGYRRVRLYAGGLADWTAGGLPLDTPDDETPDRS